jgi:dipeptidyl aminopeptidase/acylaminoacyl peptidase
MTATHVLSAEELADRRYPKDVRVSNDGRLVAFVVQPMGKPEEHDLSEVWLSRNRQPARQFTTGLAGDACPVFSPDSKRLAFLSDRHERKKQRIYVMAIDSHRSKASSRRSPGRRTASIWPYSSPIQRPPRRRSARKSETTLSSRTATPSSRVSGSSMPDPARRGN